MVVGTTGEGAARAARAAAIAAAGSLEAAMAHGTLSASVDLALSEAIVLGLHRLGVRTYLCVLGHGSTEVGEVLRVYEAAGVVRTVPVRHETEAAHAATALRWVTGETAAVVTSIGPGAMHALAGSLASASDGIGVWHLYGDETTEAEGPNMQQIPKPEQELFLRLCATFGSAYSLHTPAALPTALRRGANVVEHPHRAGPFYLLLPMNTQPAVLHGFNLAELPSGAPPPLGAAADTGSVHRTVARRLLAAERVVVKVGGGARDCGRQLDRLLELVDGVAVTSPLVSGVLPYGHPRNMTVGGSKGSLCGNFAMEHADLLVAVGTRAVCQSDCSRTGYPGVTHVVNVNADVDAATHYGHTTALVGDAAATLERLLAALDDEVGRAPVDAGPSPWLSACQRRKEAWDLYKAERYASPTRHDEVWGAEVLTQPAAIKIITDLARARDAVCFFDAGDVQANGFQVVEDDRLGRTFTETGASYMGFAASAVLASRLASDPSRHFHAVALTGDGSFTMNPQVLIDGVANGARGTIAVLDNRRMGAISALQRAQHGRDHATWDHVPVDYVAWARSVSGVAGFRGGSTPEELTEVMGRALDHDGLSLVHVPVYFGDDPLGGLGAWGRWNVGSWVEQTQAMRHEIGL
ncbi:MAG: thiamine pyrophosphate-dependent enzyme [Acidimicrobiales bacterium]|jgi:3D-(3,5/4)-trihydroxycyclohexane-1,2-dione acylhydrolase (decyclizing)|nr:thiamine pyrophosphate-dependent enzyme [Acidimicrobiales bacterium]